VSRKKRFGWPTLIGVLVAIPCLWWALRDVHLAEVARHVAGARLIPLMGMALASLLIIPADAARWRHLLHRDKAGLPFVPLFHATAGGLAVNNMLPARAGEIARAYAARRLTGVRFSSALTSIMFSVLLDGTAFVLALGVAGAMGWFSPDLKIAGLAVADALAVAAGVLLGLYAVALLVVWVPVLVTIPTARIGHLLLPERWANALMRGLEGILNTLEILRYPRLFAGAFGWTAVMWALGATSFFLGFLAFDLRLPVHAAIVTHALVNVGMAVPSTPGFVGVFEALTRGALTFYGTAPTTAVSYAVVYHFCSYVPATLLGLWSLAQAQIKMSEVQEEVHERVTVAVKRVTVTVQRLTGTYKQVD
jgi:uncharacterized protein (TIRG00374 family)